jgi:hypothetical protein
MARLRLIVIGLVACRAEAAPGSGVHVPASWRALPELAAAVASAGHASASEAWGDPAAGCYATWLAVVGAPVAADAILAEVQRDAPGITLTDLVEPQGPGKLAFAFDYTALPSGSAAGHSGAVIGDRAPYRGRVRATVAGDGAIAALACFWNDREAAACAVACTGVLGSLP